MSPRSPPDPLPITDYVADGTRIAGILLVWGIIAVFFSSGISEIGGPGSLFATYGPQFGALFVLTGVVNAILYVVYRGLDYR